MRGRRAAQAGRRSGSSREDSIRGFKPAAAGSAAQQAAASLRASLQELPGALHSLGTAVTHGGGKATYCTKTLLQRSPHRQRAASSGRRHHNTPCCRGQMVRCAAWASQWGRGNGKAARCDFIKPPSRVNNRQRRRRLVCGPRCRSRLVHCMALAPLWRRGSGKIKQCIKKPLQRGPHGRVCGSQLSCRPCCQGSGSALCSLGTTVVPRRWQAARGAFKPPSRARNRQRRGQLACGLR